MAQLIDHILSDASLFGDGPPHWQQGRANEPAQTAVEADRQRIKIVRFAKKHSTTYPALAALYFKMGSCTTTTPCTSAACPRCSRALQRWLVKAGGHLVQEMSGDSMAIRCVSVVPTRAATSEKPASATAGTVKNALIRLRRGFDQAGITLFVGALDFSFNEVHGSPRPGRLSVHVWGLGDEGEVKVGRESLKLVFPAHGSTTRPVKTYAFDGNPRAIAYAYKSNFTRRVALTSERRTGVKLASCRNTRARPLRVQQKAELLVLLDALGLLKRLVLRGVTIAETTDGVRLTRSSPASIADVSTMAKSVEPAENAARAEPAISALPGQHRSVATS